MIKPEPPRSRGIAGVLFVCFVAVATAGLLIDLLVLAPVRIHVLAVNGGRALLGAAIAIAAILIAAALRWALGRGVTAEGDARASDHA